jgi:transcriptional regulator with GAF, ATPase, and Fis domain
LEDEEKQMAMLAYPREAESRNRILIVSPDDEFRKRIVDKIGLGLCLIEEALGGADALAKLEAQECQALFLDRRIADLHLEELLGILKQDHPDLDVKLVDSRSDLDALLSFASELSSGGREAEEHRFPGASEFNADRVPAPSAGATSLGTVPSIVEPLPGMLISRGEMQATFRLARMVAQRDTPVLITGETGTGKELVAQAIHKISLRVQGPFVIVNCAAIPETLLESELFGYVRGAFTGAIQSRIGRIHGAHGGTLFLDEVGELPLSMQAKLLRFLQHGEVQRLGSSDVFRVDVRVIAATNVDLAKQVAERLFRSDLYYRLAVFPIDLPPLRKRTEDILPLAEYFLDGLCRESDHPAKHLSSGAALMLRRYAWPGNVRELEHALERAFILAESSTEISSDLFHLDPANSSR